MRNAAHGLLVGIGASALCASAASGVDLPEPVFTYCELERSEAQMSGFPGRGIEAPSNDQFSEIESIVAPTEFADCFYITGKLHKDCVWDRQPKCCLVEYSKPLQAFDSEGRSLGLVEEVLQVADVFSGEAVMNLSSLIDRTIRIGVTSVFDCFDGTLNGLFSNGLHGDLGEVRLIVDGGGVIETYDFRFEEGREALRLAYVIPSAPGELVTVTCFDSTGTKEVCYDVDFYWVQGLTPRELYCITQVGGKNYDCEATDTSLGWFDKNGNLQGGDLGFAESSEGNNVSVYPEMCVIADDLGDIRFAITGVTDDNFNGLVDEFEEPFFELLEELEYIEDTNNVTKGEGWTPGASAKTNPNDLVRLSREDFDEHPLLANPPDHTVCGCYTLKVRLNEHTDEGGDDDDDFGGGGLAARADMSGDGLVDAVDLAMLLSFWGPVQ